MEKKKTTTPEVAPTRGETIDIADNNAVDKKLVAEDIKDLNNNPRDNDIDQ